MSAITQERLAKALCPRCDNPPVEGKPECEYHAQLRRNRAHSEYKRMKEYDRISLTASGWTLIGQAGGGSWSVPSRPRVDKHPLQTKMRWQIESTTCNA